MQPLPETTKSALSQQCARELLDSVPPFIWFIRRQMRKYRSGLSLPQFRSLARVNRPPQATLSAVAEHLGSTLPTASRIVGGLANKGLVSRGDCKWDRRQVLFELTPRGRQVLEAARKAAQMQLEVELNKLTPQDRRSLMGATKILKSLFGPARPDAPRPNGRKTNGAMRR
jgi:DNA-binding MarR family transcriptional regulator